MLILPLLTGKCLFVCALPLVSKSKNAKEVLCALRGPLSASKSENVAKVCAFDASSSRAVAVLLAVWLYQPACVRAVLLTVWLAPALCLLMRRTALHPAVSLLLPPVQHFAPSARGMTSAVWASRESRMMHDVQKVNIDLRLRQKHAPIFTCTANLKGLVKANSHLRHSADTFRQSYPYCTDVQETKRVKRKGTDVPNFKRLTKRKRTGVLNLIRRLFRSDKNS